MAEAYAQHASQVYSVAQSLCGGTRAEDITQEIFLQLWRNPQRYDAQDGSLRSFLLRQAHRRALDVLRTDEARNAREAAESDGAVLDLVDRAAVSSFVTALPENERQPIVLAYFGGHTYREVARILGLPDGTVKSLVRSGLERLRTSRASAIRLD